MQICTGVCKLQFKLRSQINVACKYLQSVTQIIATSTFGYIFRLLTTYTCSLAICHTAMKEIYLKPAFHVTKHSLYYFFQSIISCAYNNTFCDFEHDGYWFDGFISYSIFSGFLGNSGLKNEMGEYLPYIIFWENLCKIRALQFLNISQTLPVWTLEPVIFFIVMFLTTNTSFK